MTIRQTIQTIEEALSPLYDSREATAIAREVVCRVCGYTFSQLVINYDSECNIENLQTIIDQLAASRPVQYVTGVAEFCDLEFKVCEGVLIPRPETAELVAQIVADSRPGAKILDVGTGSGAIAVALAKSIEGAEITAVDISDIALEIASENGVRNGVNIRFCKADALDDMSSLGEFDVIVSNPPYIPQSDIVDMRKNVVDFEPHTALFVPDNDILRFYRATAKNAQRMLRKEGSIWFEIYEKAGVEVCEMLCEMGFTHNELIEDANLKPRMVWSRR